jgi:hypothetical protein
LVATAAEAVSPVLGELPTEAEEEEAVVTVVVAALQIEAQAAVAPELGAQALATAVVWPSATAEEPG